MKALLVSDEPKSTPLNLGRDQLAAVASDAGLWALRQAAEHGLEVFGEVDGRLSSLKASVLLEEARQRRSPSVGQLFSCPDIKMSLQRFGFEVVEANLADFNQRTVPEGDLVVVDLNRGDRLSEDALLALQSEDRPVVALVGSKLNLESFGMRFAALLSKPASEIEFFTRIRQALKRPRVRSAGPAKGAAVA